MLSSSYNYISFWRSEKQRIEDWCESEHSKQCCIQITRIMMSLYTFKFATIFLELLQAFDFCKIFYVYLVKIIKPHIFLNSLNGATEPGTDGHSTCPNIFESVGIFAVTLPSNSMKRRSVQQRSEVTKSARPSWHLK